MKVKDTVHFNWYKHMFVWFILFSIFFLGVKMTNASFYEVFSNMDQMSAFMKRFLKPDFHYILRLFPPMLKTIQMSVVGTFMGVLASLPFAFLAVTAVSGKAAVTWGVRFFLGSIRTIPPLLLAALLVGIFGIGEFTGVLTIAIFTFGMVSQLLYEAIEVIDYGPVEAAESVGAGKVQIIFWTIIPQILSQLASYSLYAFEVNVRASTVLGYVGAGGIGILLNTSLSLFQYDRVSVIILMILGVVTVIDVIGEGIRRRFQA